MIYIIKLILLVGVKEIGKNYVKCENDKYIINNVIKAIQTIPEIIDYEIKELSVYAGTYINGEWIEENMKLEEAKHLLKGLGFNLQEKSFTNEDSTKVIETLREIKEIYESKGYIVKLCPSHKFKYYSNLGFDPTIGTDYYSTRTGEGIDYSYDIFEHPDYNVSKTSVMILSFIKKFSEDYIEYAKKHFDAHIGKGYGSVFSNNFVMNIPIKLYEDSNNEITWKIDKETKEGTVDEFKSEINVVVKEKEKLMKQNYFDNYVKDREFTRSLKDNKRYNHLLSNTTIKKLIRNINNILSRVTDRSEFIKAFNKTMKINQKYTHFVLSKKAIDKIDDYVHNNFSDENDNVYNWEYNETAQDYVTSIKDIMDAYDVNNIKELCDEFNINNLEDFQNFVVDEDFYEMPSDTYFKQDEYDY